MISVFEKKGILLFVLVLGACPAAEGDGGSTGQESSTGEPATGAAESTAGSMPTAGSSSTTHAPTTSTTVAGESSSTGEACADVVPVDNPELFNCSLQDQDCPDCHKCTWNWDGNRMLPGEGGSVCMPVHADPVAMFEPCTYEGPGQDNCGENLFCWSPDPETSDGYCVEFCGDVDGCPDGTICQGSSGYDWGCIPTCDPFEPECLDDAEQCVLSSDGLGRCGYVPDGLVSAVGDQCYGVCGEGLICVPADTFGPGCEFDACCAELCNVDNPCSDPEVECLGECGEEATEVPSACVPPQEPDPSQCPPEGAEPNYPWCSSTAGCDEGWGGGNECIDLCFCHIECDVPEDCPVPETGNASRACERVIDGTSCVLSCADGETCPDGMVCDTEFYPGTCMWQLELEPGCAGG